MYQVPNQPANKTQYLTLIDKCTQILREDRIWLRNMLKGNNEDVLYLFKGLPKNLDMKQLQIKLRKYIIRAKERQKQQQLQRFKENMQLPDFIEMAAQKKHEGNLQHSKSQKGRGPLKQSQNNQHKSSFVAKWNNYSHYNQSINLNQNRSHLAHHLGSNQGEKHILTKEWINNYKPHSFNRNLNGELENKLSNKNKWVSNLNNRHNKSSTSLTKQKNSILNSNSRFYQNNHEEAEDMNQTNKYGLGSRNSSKSLKQLENKIYEELKQFQQSRAKKESQNLNKTYSQRSVQKCLEKEKQKPPTNFPQTQKAASLSKQNIDELLKFKLGNCDFESYRKSQRSQKSHQSQTEEQPQQYITKQNTTSQKKLYHEGLFPPIEEQTERDSESQRYAEEPLRFGINNKPQFENSHKITFASFSRVSPRYTFKNHDLSEAKMIASTFTATIQEFNNNTNEASQKIQYPTINSSKPQPLTNNYFQQSQSYEQSCKKSNREPQSIYQSADKKNDSKENYVESELHKSIIESIKKSKQIFPEAVFSDANSMVLQKHRPIPQSSNTINLEYCPSQKLVNLPAPKAVSQIPSFQSSLYSSTHDQQGLFTSPQLLNQCRNFLKKTQEINFENSGLKQISGSVLHSKFQSPLNSQQKSFKETFNNFVNNGIINFPQPITITESITKDFYESNNNSEARINSLFESKHSSVSKPISIEFQTYSKPEYINNQDSFKKSEFMASSTKKSKTKHGIFGHNSVKKDEAIRLNNHSRGGSSIKKHSQIQETIALPVNPLYFNNMPNNSKQQSVNRLQFESDEPQLQNFKTSEFPLVSKQEQTKKIDANKNLPIEKLIELEQLIDNILQLNEGNIEVDSSWLKHTINNKHIFEEQVGLVLKNILKQYIEHEGIYNLVQIVNTLQKQYRKNPNYEPRTSAARNIYSLLDIEQKGYITFDDVQNFVTQLENAGVDHLQDIARHLEEVFDIADFMGVKQIGYINLYIIKNQDCFENLWKYLQQFQFEISAEE